MLLAPFHLALWYTKCMCPLWAGVHPMAGRWKGAAGDDWGGGLWRGIVRHSTGADPRPEDRNPHWAPRYDWSTETHTGPALTMDPAPPNATRFFFFYDVFPSLSFPQQIKWSRSALLSRRRSKPVSRSTPRGHVLFRHLKLKRFKWHIQKHNH